MKIYIDDFCEDLNYRKVILYIGEVNPEDLRSKMMNDYVNHMNRFNGVLTNNLMFVENCDLQDVDTEHGDDFGNSLLYLISESYIVYPLRYENSTRRYYIETALFDK